MPLYEVVILETPTKDQAKEGKLERLVLGPVHRVAKNDQSAAMAVVMEAARSEDKDLDLPDPSRMDVIVRPFA